MQSSSIPHVAGALKMVFPCQQKGHSALFIKKYPTWQSLWCPPTERFYKLLILGVEEKGTVCSSLCAGHLSEPSSALGPGQGFINQQIIIPGVGKGLQAHQTQPVPHPRLVTSPEPSLDTSRFLQTPGQLLPMFNTSSHEEIHPDVQPDPLLVQLGALMPPGQCSAEFGSELVPAAPVNLSARKNPTLNSRKCQENYVNLQSEFSSGPPRRKWMLLLLLLVFYHWGNPRTIKWTRWRSQCQREKKKKRFLTDVGGLLTWGF